MAEYIERDKERLARIRKEAQQFQDDIVCAVGTDFMQTIAEAENRMIFDILKGLQDEPAADVVEVRHGVWEQADNTKRGQKFICSVCKEVSYCTQPTRDKKWVKHCGYPRCPHCLARMDGKDEGE